MNATASVSCLQRAVHRYGPALRNAQTVDGQGPRAERAVEWLRVLATTWHAADVAEEKADLLHAIYERIVVAGPEIVSVRLTPAAYGHGLALALPEKLVMARPTGVRRGIATYRIPIEGRDEWLSAAVARSA